MPSLLHCSALLLAIAAPRRDGANDVSALAHAALSAALDELADAHPELVRKVEIGTSAEGRPIAALRLGGAATPDDAPALLLVANLEGPRVFASAVALHHARRLAADYESDGSARALLDGTVLWIVPRANPDAAEAAFDAPRSERTAGGRGIDDDRDGRQGEDPRADVDGDGLVTSLRVRDPDGRYLPDPEDERALVEAEPAKGERGVFALWPEGRDQDGDERVAEDGPHDAEVARNFPAGWEAHTGAGGLYPGSEPEARALMDFVLAHRELALVLVYDGLDNLVERPKSVKDDAPPVKRVPPPGVLESDARFLEELGKRYREATKSRAKGAESDAGTFARWCYEERGLPALAVTLWELPTEDDARGRAEQADADGAEASEGAERARAEARAGEAEDVEAAAEAPPADDTEPVADAEAADEEAAPGRGRDGRDGRDGARREERRASDDARRLAWIDAHPDEAWRFVAWRAFDHPELGAVEIGGFAPFARFDPPSSERESIADEHYEFMLSLADVLPRVRLAECARENLGGGVWRVEATLANDAFLPYSLAAARRTRSARPVRVELELPAAATLLSGNVRALVDELPGSGGRHELDWLVLLPERAEVWVRVSSDNAGSDRRLAEVQR